MADEEKPQPPKSGAESGQNSGPPKSGLLKVLPNLADPPAPAGGVTLDGQADDGSASTPISAEEFAEAFGNRGVENPRVVDLIRPDKAAGHVALMMFEPRDWAHGHVQLQQLEEKIDRYLSYVLDGFFFKQYPQYAQTRVRFELHCLHEPEGVAKDMLTAAQGFCAQNGLEFRVNAGSLTALVMANPQ